ncbi:MAG: ATP-binding cassette domain-containing protein [Nannocystaceae bacterium]|nr:ATP-binding cassette domain-containing protein [Nannocystaceae bacterium]
MSLAVRAGETLTIIGGSGQGKSVCLKMMIGLLRPDSGSVQVKGVEVPDLDDRGLTEVRRTVAYVFQGGALFDSMNVLDNVGYALREHTSMREDEIEHRAAECLELVGLETSLLHTMPANLSGGMKKRVALARSIAMRPEVILYDEPTTGLDPKNIARIGDMIVKLQRELSVTSVVVTHDMPMAYKVSDRVAMLYERAFPFVDTPDAMWNSASPEVANFIHGRIADGKSEGPHGVA